MSIISNYDIGNNFWEINPTYKVLGDFAKFYRADTSKEKWASSKAMWAVALFTDLSSENKFKNLPEDERKILISEEMIRDPKFKWSRYENLIVFYRKIETTTTERSLISLRKKMEERESFLAETSYNLENAKDLDSIIANTDKLFSLISRLESQIEKEKNIGGGITKGGRTESLSENKII